MGATLYTPYLGTHTIELSANQWRKQLLPLGTITYQGRKINFSKKYLSDLVKAFKDRAVDTVPLQLAGADNKHTNAVKQRGGTIVGMELVDDGLDVIVESEDPDVAKLMKLYPDTGVSARIYEGYQRESDGRHWPAALQHVLMTLDPHITGLRPWQPVIAMSNNDKYGDVIDLTDATFGKEEDMPRSKASLKATLAKLKVDDEAELTDEELDQLLAIIDQSKDPEDGELTDEELQALLDAAEADDTDDPPVPVSSDPAVVAATARHTRALELANARLEQQATELANVQARLDREAFEREKLEFANKYGIPPVVTEKARKLLQGTGHVIEFANGSEVEEVDAAEIMRDVLRTIGGQIKILDLSGLIGNGLPPDDDEKAEQEKVAKERTDFLEQAKATFKF